MGKSKPTQRVTEYRMSLQFGICVGPLDFISEIVINDKEAWCGHRTLQSVIDIDKPELFGGIKKEGGAVGDVHYYIGDDIQTIDETLAARVGRTTATMPAYRGVAHAWFTEPAGAGRKGFYWSANQPFIPSVSIRASRASTGLGELNARIFRGIGSVGGRRSYHFALDDSGSLNGLKMETLQASLIQVFDLLKDQIENGCLVLDIMISTFGTTGVERTESYTKATPANLDSLKTFVNSFTALGTNTDWRTAATRAANWFGLSASDTSIDRRIFLLVSDGAPNAPGKTPQEVTDESVTTMSDILGRNTGTYQGDLAVDCFGINIEDTDIQYTSQLDNTPQDGVPIVSGGDTVELLEIFEQTIADLFDSNPAHIIYECLTDVTWGMGAPQAAIDVPSFTAAAQTLYDENFGLSMIWTRQIEIEKFVSEILDHIEATLFVNPRTGLLTLKLIRGDYSISGLQVFTPDNANVTKFSRKLWGETINEIIVTYTDPDTQEDMTVVAQDNANIAMQGGIVSDGRNYYGIRSKVLAATVAQRDLRSAATPLASCDIEVNREAWDLLPGDVVELNSPEDQIASLIMRVGRVDYGKPGDPTVRASLVEDVFALGLSDFTVPPDTIPIDPSENPSPADFSLIMTVPYFLAVNKIDPGVLQGMAYPEVFASVLAAEDGTDTAEFDLIGDTVDAAGNPSTGLIGTMTIASHATLPDDLVPEVQTVFADFPDATQGSGPTVGGFMLIEAPDLVTGNVHEEASELCLIKSFGTGGWVLERGVLDTVPRRWNAGTPVWFIDDSMTIIDNEIRAETELVSYQILPRTSRGILAQADAPVISETLTARPHLPLRNANVKVDSVAFGPVDVIGVSPIPVTWSRRNRLTEDSLVLAWDDPDVTPETDQETIITLHKLDGTLLKTYSGITGTSHNVVVADFAGEAEGLIRVKASYSGSGALESLQYFETHVYLISDAKLFEDGDNFVFEDGDKYRFE